MKLRSQGLLILPVGDTFTCLFKGLHMRQFLFFLLDLHMRISIRLTACILIPSEGLKIGIDYKLRLPEPVLYRIHNGIVNHHSVRETNLQLLGMNIDIHNLRIHIYHKHRKGELMLHEEGMIGILYGLCDHRVLHKSRIHEIYLEIPVGSCDDRLSDEAADSNSRKSRKL